MKSTMTKKQCINFYSSLTGHTKTFVQKNLKQIGFEGTYQFASGMQRFISWMVGNRIYCLHFLCGSRQGTWYFTNEDFDKDFEVDWDLIKQDTTESLEDLLSEMTNNWRDDN